MTVFADASALIAIIAAEADALTLADCLEGDQKRLYSALSGWETVAGLCRAYRLTVPQAQTRVRLFLTELGFRMVAVGEAEFALATEAYARFGKGRHPANLNMGDCFAYACAKANRARLLFKGDDFVKTDIEPALIG
ncbi:MAG TPA: type II toxin-antitoxin system VapC family toxin [Rhodopila sp.]|nr:type II toxin-antitoxin system VapC family toxin [Rhodopila sp.]